jgi:hypothetical protein
MWIRGNPRRAYESRSPELREVFYRRRRIADRGTERSDGVHTGHADIPGARAGSLRHENSKLKQVVADLTLDRHILQEIVRKKL